MYAAERNPANVFLAIFSILVRQDFHLALSFTEEGSVITSLKEQSGSQTPEAYFYSGDGNTANIFPQSTLTTVFDRKVRISLNLFCS